MKKCAIVYNSHSGRKKYLLENLEHDFNDILIEYGYTAAYYKSNYEGAVTDIIQNLDDDLDLVISIGGDGTFSEALKGNFKREKKLVISHLPTGTTNDIGKMYGYGKDMINNLRLLLSGEEKKVDVCTINNIPFAYVSGFGRFLNIPYETSRKNKKIFGYLAYIGRATKELFARIKTYNLSYEVNGEVHEGNYSLVLVTNSTRIAALNSIFNDIKLDDGYFEVLLCDLKKRNQFAKSLIYLASNDIKDVPGLYYYKTNKITINNIKKDKIEWDIDGERVTVCGEKIVIELAKTMIRIPSKNISNLFVNKS